MSPFLTIILPVYNVEPYLKKCMDSLVNQTYSNIEIICINDGSTDGSLKILEEYANNDTRIKLINQENQGVAAARNVGIENAVGEYLMFVDSDDWIDIEACQKLYDCIQGNDSDVISFNFYSVTKDYIRKVRIPYCSIGEQKIQEWGHWNRFYKTSFIKENSIRYPQNIKIGEDVIFLSYVLLNKPKTDYLDEYLYYYLADRGDGATKDYSQSLLTHINSYNYLKSQNIFINASNIDKSYITDLWARSFFNLWSNLPKKYLSKENEKLINVFIKDFEQYQNAKKTIGYKRLKYRNVYRVLKNIRNLYFKIKGII